MMAFLPHGGMYICILILLYIGIYIYIYLFFIFFIFFYFFIFFLIKVVSTYRRNWLIAVQRSS